MFNVSLILNKVAGMWADFLLPWEKCVNSLHPNVRIILEYKSTILDNLYFTWLLLKLNTCTLTKVNIQDTKPYFLILIPWVLFSQKKNEISAFKIHRQI